MSDPASPPPQVRLRGVRTHNLQGVDLDLPLAGLTVLVGPSGSGKTSLAVDTLHAASRSRLATALGETERPAPPVDRVEHLPLTLCVQAPAPPRAADRVAEEAALVDVVATTAAAVGVVHCPRCGRALPHEPRDAITGRLAALPEGSRMTLAAPVARDRREGIGALVAEIGRQGFARVRLDGALQRVEDVGTVDARVAHDLDVIVDRVRWAPDRVDRLDEAVGTTLAAGRGRLLVEVRLPDRSTRELAFAERPWCPDHPELQLEPPRPEWLARRGTRWACGGCAGAGTVDGATCPDCRGSGLRAEAAHLHLPAAGQAEPTSWPELLARPAGSALDLLAAAARDAGLAALAPPLDAARDRLVALGLAHLPLDRPAGDLGDGERSRLALLRTLSVDLPGSLLILDEPVAGLDPGTARRVAAVIRAAADRGTPVVAIDHRQELLAVADHAVAFGPAAGRRGGRITWQGAARDLPAALLPSPPDPSAALPGPGTDGLCLRGARGRVLAGVDLRLPPGALTAVTGPTGSGKSTLLLDTLVPALRRHLDLVAPAPLPHGALEPAGIGRVLVADRRPLGGGHRSFVATVLDLWTPLRQLLARTREARILGLDAAHFRLDRSGGRCESCGGTGLRILPALAGAEELRLPCPDCDGRRFQRDALRVRLKGLDVAGLLDLELADAARRFQAFPRLAPALLAAEVVGLGYLPLGQASDSLSGGEAQRLRLARVLADVGGVGAASTRQGSAEDLLVVLDGPTVGLHPGDAAAVIEVLRRLADRGATVVAATVEPQLLAAADHVLVLPQRPETQSPETTAPPPT